MCRPKNGEFITQVDLYSFLIDPKLQFKFGTPGGPIPCGIKLTLSSGNIFKAGGCALGGSWAAESGMVVLRLQRRPGNAAPT